MISVHRHAPRELKSRYPYMLSGETSRVSLTTGWIDLFAQLCADIDAALGKNRSRFRWIQVTEKWGSMRCYWRFGYYEPPLTLNIVDQGQILTAKVPSVRRRKIARSDEALMKRIGLLVNEVEMKTRQTCIACGMPGQMDSTGEYLLVLCPEHARQRRNETLSDFWFDPAE